MLKKGDKVRFLNETGGGVVTGFREKNIVLVEDGDGFEIPTLVSNVVVVESDDYGTGRMVGAPAQAPEAPAPGAEERDYDPAEREVTFKAPAAERPGGDRLSAWIAFVPREAKDFSKTSFDCYFVNDSNYWMRYVIFREENSNCSLWHGGLSEPNTKEFVAETEREDLGSLERLDVQIIPYKRDRSFVFKPAVSLRMRIDTVKFYKLHAFAENDFFEQGALLFPVVENDAVPRAALLDAAKLREGMCSGNGETGVEKKTAEIRKTGRDETVVVDLHAAELLETTAGMSGTDIFNYQMKVFRETLEKYAREKGRKIIFIHGKGDGVLKHAIIHQLGYRYKKYQYQDASFADYGYGATQVTIR